MQRRVRVSGVTAMVLDAPQPAATYGACARAHTHADWYHVS
jgi:hypothetical protein